MRNANWLKCLAPVDNSIWRPIFSTTSAMNVTPRVRALRFRTAPAWEHPFRNPLSAEVDSAQLKRRSRFLRSRPSRPAPPGQHRSNMIPSSQTSSCLDAPGRTAAETLSVITHYAFAAKRHLSRHPTAGNLGGNSERRLGKSLSLHRKSIRFDSSPGHSWNFL